MLRLCFLLPAFAAVVGCTVPPESGTTAASAAAQPRQCFWASEVTGFGNAGPDVVLANISRRETWALELSPGCPDVDTALKIGIVSRGTQRICSGRDAELIIPSVSGTGTQRCLVRSVRLLSPEETEAVRGKSPT